METAGIDAREVNPSNDAQMEATKSPIKALSPPPDFLVRRLFAVGINL
jgi:hypothetical protein